MTFTKLSAAGKDAVCPFNKAPQDKSGIDPTGAHDPDGAQVGWILVTGNSGCISRSIATPVAQKSKDPRVVLFLAHFLSFNHFINKHFKLPLNQDLGSFYLFNLFFYYGFAKSLNL
jgi:hypothetical protein